MKKHAYSILFLLAGIISTATIQITEECDATALKKELKRELRPEYKYDSSKISRFTYKDKTQVKEIEVPLFMGEKYRFLFNTAGFSQNVKVEIYNKKIGHKKRKLLYEIEPIDGKHIYIFEPKKSRKMYINYTIPKAEVVDGEEPMKGCAIFLLGYRLTVLKLLD
jgi:hypothetical protein